MKIFSVGFDFKTAPLELRARGYSKDPEFLKSLAAECSEKVMISTCNRSEVYGLGPEGSAEMMIDRWAKLSGLKESEKSCFRIYYDQECLSHLFRVASGMESMVVGEAQIGGQVKKSYDEAMKLGTIGTQFHRVFQRAFKVAKKVRAQTEVGRLAVSIPSIGVKLAEKVLGDLSTKTVGIIGLGEMGRLAAEYFGSIQPKKLLLYNRTASVASELQLELQKEGVNSEVVGTWNEILAQASVIVSAVDAVLIKETDLKNLDRKAVPLFVLDLSLPPSIERCELEDIYLYGLDDLKKIASENSRLREQEVEKAESIIVAESAECFRALQTTSVSETFTRLASKVESITAEELKALRARLGTISDKDWIEIEKMASRLTSKVVQDPMMELKSQIQSGGESESLIQFFRNIFRI